MAALNPALLHLGDIAVSPDAQLFLHQFFHSWIEHRRHLVKNHTLYLTVCPVFQKSFQIGGQRHAHPSGIDNQYHRRLRLPRKIIGTGLGGDAAYTVIVAHHALHHGQLHPSHILLQQPAHGVAASKKSVQVPGFCPDHLTVKHGIYVIRPAFKRGRLNSPVFHRLQKSAGNQRLSAAAGSRGQQNSGYLHSCSPLWQVMM